MRNDLKTNMRLYELDLENLNQETRDLFRQLINNYGQPFIWDISERSTVFSNNDDLDSFLIKDFGDRYLIYSIYYKSYIIGIVGLTHINKDFTQGELIIGIRRSYRLRHDFLVWWTDFLKTIKKKGIITIYGRIKKENVYVINLSKKFGFIRTLEHFHTSISTLETYNIKRDSSLNSKELYFLQHKSR